MKEAHHVLIVLLENILQHRVLRAPTAPLELTLPTKVVHALLVILVNILLLIVQNVWPVHLMRFVQALDLFAKMVTNRQVMGQVV